MKYSASCLVPAALLLAGCTEILNIDVHYDDGGGGTGPSNGGNGAGVSNGGNGGSDPDGVGGAGLQGGTGAGGQNTGGSSPDCTTADEFSSGSSWDTNCWWEIHPGYVTPSVSGGELHLQVNGASSETSWYHAEQGYYLFRHLTPGPFAVVTKVRVTNRNDDGVLPAAAPNTYHVAGLVIRDPIPVDNEHWLKLEAGYRSTDPGFAGHTLGTLAATTVNNVTTHVTPYDMQDDIEVELGACRSNDNHLLLFVRNEPSQAFVQEEGSSNLDNFTITQGAEVGLTATAFNGPQFDIAGHFAFVRFAENPSSIANPLECENILTSLANQGANGDCGCTSPDEGT